MNTALDAQTAGNCMQEVCDGSGAPTAIVDDTDLPDDGKACTTDTCNAGVPVFTPVGPGVDCGGGFVCDAAGNCPGCTLPEDCTGPSDDCRQPDCQAGNCVEAFDAAGTATTAQTAGDCKTNQCDGIGHVVDVNDDTDPTVDASQCTANECSDGTPANPPLPLGTTCSQGGGSHCNATGTCVQCNIVADCGVATECKSFTCTGGTCNQVNVASGTVTTAQTAGDCHRNQCDGSGNIVNAVFNGDVPVDGMECTDDVCTAGVPSNPPSATTQTCTGGHCDGSGSCVGCTVPGDCGVDTECHTFTCSASHVCQQANAPLGTPTSTQTAGDCHRNQCDGVGNVVNAIFNTDLPIDGVQCTSDVCTAGVASNPPSAANDPCGPGGAQFCDGGGACVECNAPSQCASLVCTGHACQAPSCIDTVMNGTETGTDCGGSCPGCADGQPCDVGADCLSGNCNGTVCVPALSVTSTVPADSATAIDPLAAISITFSEAVDPASITVKQTLDTGPCTGSIQVSSDAFATCYPLGAPSLTAGDTVVAVAPAPGLSFGSAYRVRVTTTVETAGGSALGAAFTQANGFVTRGSTSSKDGLVVISQVYGAGGNSGATYTNDFIELHNMGTTPVVLTGRAVQYGSATGTTWQVTALTGTIPAGGYWLVGESSGGAVGAALPAPDSTGTIAMAAGAGKVAFTSSATALVGACPTGGTVLDLVGYGPTANCSETLPAPIPTAILADVRAGSGCIDAGSNATDFALATPVAHASTGPTTAYCSIVDNETGYAQEIDTCSLESPTTLSVQAGLPSGAILCSVLEAGVTSGVGQGMGLTVEVGYGPISANPENQAGWTWSPALYTQDLGTADEYGGSFVAPAAGAYRYACRVTDPTGSLTYCDIDGAGSAGGKDFATLATGPLTVTP